MAEDRNARLKEHGYGWRKPNGSWQLFDPRGEVVSEQQALTAIANGTVPEPLLITCLDDRPAAIRWAQGVIEQRKIAVLDTEATGLLPTSRVIEVAVVELDGSSLFHSLVACPTQITEDAYKIHGISNAMLRDAHAPEFPAIWDELAAILQKWEIIIYNAGYDLRLLCQTASAYGLEMPPTKTHCLMKQYAQFAGVLKPGTTEYAYQSLSQACKHFFVPEGTHRALDDANAARGVLLAMADYER